MPNPDPAPVEQSEEDAIRKEATELAYREIQAKLFQAASYAPSIGSDAYEAMIAAADIVAGRITPFDVPKRFPLAHSKAAGAVREALEWYADTFCEHGKYSEVCGKLSPDECSGCKARQALALPPLDGEEGRGEWTSKPGSALAAFEYEQSDIMHPMMSPTAEIAGREDPIELINDAIQTLRAFPANTGEVVGRITERGDRVLRAVVDDLHAAVIVLSSPTLEDRPYHGGGEKLLPCAHCGGRAHLEPHPKADRWVVAVCTHCRISTTTEENDRRYAIRDWNRRAILALSSPTAVGMRKALEKAWTDFLDANPDDLNSPEEYPDHALVTCDQMIGIVESALRPADAEGVA